MGGWGGNVANKLEICGFLGGSEAPERAWHSEEGLLSQGQPLTTASRKKNS